MRVLLLHPEDSAPPRNAGTWDLIVDLARAHQETYAAWAAESGCDVISIHEFAKEIDDLYLLRDVLHSGMGELIDESGIDWWDVMSLELISEFRGIMLAQRLAQKLGDKCEVCSSRRHTIAASLRHWLGVPVVNLEGLPLKTFHKAVRWSHAISYMDGSQWTEIIRGRCAGLFAVLASARPSSTRPRILCPTAYVNGSRTAVSLARQLPDHQFALVYTRSNGRLRWVPENVEQFALAHYSKRAGAADIDSLLSRWETLRHRLTKQYQEFENANQTGILAKVPGLLRWGVQLREAWTQLLASENITACLCTDDSNPPTRIPLILSRKRGLPAIALHHGALDYAMAVKGHHADFYLTKSEIEHDYLQRTCRVSGEKLVRVQVPESLPSTRPSRFPDAFVFFTEPYEHFGWRRHEIYGDLVPRLRNVAERLNLRLVLKLHPFESAAWFQKILKPGERIEVVSGPLTTNFLQTVKVAITVQSSVAIECQNFNIPVFLMAWLRDSLTGYVRQLASFGVGWRLESIDGIDKIPDLLNKAPDRSSFSTAVHGVSREVLAQLLSGRSTMATVLSAQA